MARESAYRFMLALVSQDGGGAGLVGCCRVPVSNHSGKGTQRCQESRIILKESYPAVRLMFL